MNERDPAYLWDIIRAAKEIVRFLGHKRLDDLQQDRVLQLALERELEVIGEAAARISNEFRDAHPEVPWSRIIAQRNVIAHQYGDIQIERVWLVATQRVPELITQLDPLVPRLPDQGENE
jgi:uncharacterized protein with HEPN domain